MVLFYSTVNKGATSGNDGETEEGGVCYHNQETISRSKRNGVRMQKDRKMQRVI